LKVAVAGARGYAGVELCRLLLKHPNAELTSCFATAGFRLSDYLPEKSARSVPGRSTDELLSSVKNEGLQVVFLATPVEASLQLAPKLLEAGAHVIDLSGAFRLQEGSEANCAAQYQEWYGVEHSSLRLLKAAEFGLVPWIGTGAPATPSQPRLISNPGCFATAILMGLVPLLKENLIDPRSIVMDAKSGTTGAGRKAEERLLHAEVDGVCLPYRIGRHQHEPEIQQYVRRFAGVEIDPFLTTNLLNVRRGIIAGVYARLESGLSTQGDAAAVSLFDQAFAKAYGEDRLVEVARIGEGGDALLNLRRVVGSARTQISYKVVRDRVYVFSVIDNLMKGAASQAVENFNRLTGAPTWMGLENVEGVI
jgi:N-acetyl-gamma-glutamyl-phosphate reductase